MTIDPSSCTRSSSVTGYLDPIVENRNNLFVLTGALVTRVLLDSPNTLDKPRAVGVEIYVPGTQKRVEVRHIRREVILSAGRVSRLFSSALPNESNISRHI
jgi:choline dehydrogenase-like flavoprotein